MHSPEELRRHVELLCAQFSVMLYWGMNVEPDAGSAGLINPRTGRIQTRRQADSLRVVKCPMVFDETTYCAALHELGHVVHPQGILPRSDSCSFNKVPVNRDDIENTLTAERNAWEWAKANALEWTPVMQSVKAMTFNTYVRWAVHWRRRIK